MIQDQLVEYISSQIKTGISRDVIKSALVAAGWQTEDVEDTLKKIEGEKTQQVGKEASQPIASNTPIITTASPLVSFSPSDIVGTTKNVAASQPVRMDSTAPIAGENTNKSFFDKKTSSIKPLIGSEDNKGSKVGDFFKTMNSPSEYPQSNKGNKIATIIEAVIILGLAAFSCFLYLQNITLSAKVGGLGGQTDASSQISNLNTQIQTFTASNTELTNRVASLTAENANLQMNLSFLIIPPANISGSSSVVEAPVMAMTTMSGALSRNTKGVFILTTTYGIKISVKNSSDVKVAAALTPLIGNTVQVSGTYIQGSPSLTITDVNGSSLIQPAVPMISSTSQNVPPIPSATAPQ